MNRWKQTAVVLTVVVSVLSGCGFIVEERPPQQGANESAPGVVQSSPRTGFICPPAPEGPGVDEMYSWGGGIIKNDINNNGYTITGNGNAWLDRKTGEYCVEEGGSISFPNGPKLKGPRIGNYFTDAEKAVCYATTPVIPDRKCDGRRKENVLRLTRGWFQGQCDDEKVRQFLKDHGISLEDPHWEDCDSLGLWKGIALPK